MHASQVPILEPEHVLETLHASLSADAVQWVSYRTPTDPKVLKEITPSPDISENLLRTAALVPEIAQGAPTMVNTYRFGGQLVHLVAAETQAEDWLLVWVRLPESANPEPVSALVRVAAAALIAAETSSARLPNSQPKENLSPHAGPAWLEMINPAKAVDERLSDFCSWLGTRSGFSLTFLARKSWNGWRIVASSQDLPTINSPLNQVLRQLMNTRSESAALQEVERFTSQSHARKIPLSSHHVLIVTGAADELGQERLEEAQRLVALLDPKFQLAEKKLSHHRWWLWLLLFGLAACMFIPIDHPIHTPVLLEPAERRYVAAPFQAIVERVHARAGEVVERDQILVELDGREIRERLSEVEARLSSATLQTSAAQEAGNYSDAAIRALEVRSLSHERELLRNRQEHLILRSPVHGVVVTGDLERSEGAAVDLGQPLLELAPLEKLVAELDVNEADISLVRPGQSLRIQLHAQPGRPQTSTILRLAPRSEIRDGQNVFVAEAELGNPENQLRPGMKGKAVISGDRHSLGYVLLRKPWHMLQRWLFR
ncbi:MAG: efflux RND transporter periplasmic adaptor subunit [Verrucomicrobiales bacterium]